MKVCVVKTSSMGDILHTLPALTDAQVAIPQIQFDWVVEESFVEIPQWHSAVNNIIPIALRRWRKQPFNVKVRSEWQTYRTLLQSQYYDAVIDAQGLLKSAFFATRLVDGVKHGYDRHSIREPLASFFYDRRYAISYQQHAVERIRQLFAYALGYSFPETTGDYAIAHRFQTKTLNTTEQPYMVFIHATTRQDKYWLEEYWRTLIEQVTKQRIRVKLPWGTDDERLRAQRLAEGFEYVDVLPKTTLSEIAYIIANASAVVAVDTGLSHLTAALDIPNVGLYGATDPKLIGSYGKNQTALCGNSMADITPERVYQTLSQYIP